MQSKDLIIKFSLRIWKRARNRRARGKGLSVEMASPVEPCSPRMLSLIPLPVIRWPTDFFLGSGWWFCFFLAQCMCLCTCLCTSPKGEQIACVVQNICKIAKSIRGSRKLMVQLRQ